MKKRISDWNSTPIENYFRTLSARETRAIVDEITHLNMAAHKERPVQYHKARLGEQDYTWVGEFRFWVWESRETALGTPSRWRMFANNEKGCCFELEEHLTPTQVRTSWDDYRRRTLLLQWPPGTRVLCYADDEPGVIVGPCPKYRDSYLVLSDGEKKHHSIQIGNIVEAK